VTYLLVESLIKLLQKRSPGVLNRGVDLVKGDDDSFSSEGVDEAAIAAKPFL
jgi:hypothetical protein